MLYSRPHRRLVLSDDELHDLNYLYVPPFHVFIEHFRSISDVVKELRGSKLASYLKKFERHGGLKQNHWVKTPHQTLSSVYQV